MTRLTARIIFACAAEVGPFVTGVTKVYEFSRAVEVDPRDSQGRGVSA